MNEELIKKMEISACPIRRVSVNLKGDQVERISFLMYYLGLDSIQEVYKYLVLQEYRKIKEDEIKYGSSTSSKQKKSLADKLVTMRGMNDEDLTKHIISLGYDKFQGEREIPPDNELGLPETNPKMMYDKIMTMTDGTRHWFQSTYYKNDPTKKVIYFVAMWSLEALIKELVKINKIK